MRAARGSDPGVAVGKTFEADKTHSRTYDTERSKLKYVLKEQPEEDPPPREEYTAGIEEDSKSRRGIALNTSNGARRIERKDSASSVSRQQWGGDHIERTMALKYGYQFPKKVSQNVKRMKMLRQEQLLP